MKKILTAAWAVAGLVIAMLPLEATSPYRTLDRISVKGNTVTFTTSEPTKYHVSRISNPPRLIVEFSNTEHNLSRKETDVNGKIIQRIRSGQYENDPVKIARAVLDLKRMVDYQAHAEGNSIILALESAGETSDEESVEVKTGASLAKPMPPAATKPSASSAVSRPPMSTSTRKMSSKAPEPSSKTAASRQTAKKTSESPAAPAPISPLSTSSQTASVDKAPVALSSTSVTRQDSPVSAEEGSGLITKNGSRSPSARKKLSGSRKSPGTSSAETAATAAPKNPPVAGSSETAKSVSTEKAVESPSAAAATAAAPVPTVSTLANPRLEGNASVAPEQKRDSGGRIVLPRKLITVDFEEADIRDVLRILSIKSGINIIYSSDVSGTITLRLENVPFDNAFETILSLKGLVSQEQGPNIIRVATPLRISEERSQAVTFTKIFPLNYAKAEEVKLNLDAIRTAEGRKGSTAVDARTNSLIITDTPDGLISAENIINELDKKPAQVIIEARIVEVVLTKDLDLGIEWSYANTLANDPSNKVFIGQTNAQTSPQAMGTGAQVGGTVITPIAASVGGTGVSFPATTIAGQMSGISFGIVGSQSVLTGRLSALAQKGLSKLLSNPKVTTINNKEARILVGQRIPYTTTTVSQGASTQQTNFLDVGIKLTVTPTINIDQKITLQVHPEVSLFIRSDPAGPVIGTREAQTTVLVNNGETVVIGGLITEDDRKLGTQVPLLGDLPVLGHLFKRQFDNKERTELLVFLTPQIMNY